jgi:succinyl-CoA synthetase beta subunit
VVRLEGTNVELGRSIIEEAGIAGLLSATDMRDGARKIVEATL